jgi:cell division protease FtsH
MPKVTDAELEAFVEQARYRGPTVGAERLVGLDACLRQLAGQLALLDRPELAERFGLEPSGTLFIGPPGTGKTLVARHLAGRLDVPLYQFSADEFGADPDLLHAVFRRLGGERAILFLDEVSILGQRRQGHGARPEDRRMLAALLTSLDGLPSSAERNRLWVIGACTDDILLDPAIHRSGRLGVVIEFAEPSEEQRRQLLELYLGDVPNTLDDRKVRRLAEIANEATGADIADWISQAASEVLGEDAGGAEPVIEYRHLEAVALRRGFIAATGRAGREPGWDTAVHEAGHAVVAYALFGRDALARVGIGWGQGPGRLGGSFRGHFELSDEWFAEHRANSVSWPDYAALYLAGMCAEQLVRGRFGEGAKADVRKATDLLVNLLEHGDRDFGPARYAIESATDSDEGVVGSELMRRRVWALVRDRYERCRARAAELVGEHRAAIERLATELHEGRHNLAADEIVELIGDVPAPAARPETLQGFSPKAG